MAGRQSIELSVARETFLILDTRGEQLQNTTIVPGSTCGHIFKERDMCRNNLTQVAGYSAV